jgi:prepilin-type N-terminal cleavage/methylation domain-containing protein
VIKAAGFTLIEMLITMSILSMVVLAGSSAFGFFSQQWDGSLGKFDQSMSNSRNIMLVQEILDNLIPYMAYDSKDQPSIYFEGNRNGFVAVSGRSLFKQERLAVVRFSVRQNTDLTFDVLYEEWPMEDEVLVSANTDLPFYPPLVLFRSVTEAEFGYFGWSDILSKKGNGGDQFPQPPAWYPSLNAVASSVAPIKARLRFKFKDNPYELLSVLAEQPSNLITRYSGARKRQPSQQQDDSGEGNGETSCFC